MEDPCPTVSSLPRACTADPIVGQFSSLDRPEWVHSITLRHWHAVPVYFQLATQLRELRERGIIGPGEPFPQLHKLASWIGVGKKTVRSAATVLEHDRVIQRRGSDFRFA